MGGWMEGRKEGVEVWGGGVEGLLTASLHAESRRSLQWERNSAAIKPGFITARPEMEGEDGDRDGGGAGGASNMQRSKGGVRGGGETKARSRQHAGKQFVLSPSAGWSRRWRAASQVTS